MTFQMIENRQPPITVSTDTGLWKCACSDGWTRVRSSGLQLAVGQRTICGKSRESFPMVLKTKS